MKRVSLVTYDYDPVDRSEWAISLPAILIDDYTLLTKDDDFLDIYSSETPIKVSADNSVIVCGFVGTEIHLNESAKALDILEVATMTVAQLTKFLLFGGN